MTCSHPDCVQAVVAAIFDMAFTHPEMVVDLMKSAGNLRAASDHAREFTPEDLRDLRLTWKTLEAGLMVFTDDYEIVE